MTHPSSHNLCILIIIILYGKYRLQLYIFICTQFSILISIFIYNELVGNSFMQIMLNHLLDRQTQKLFYLIYTSLNICSTATKFKRDGNELLLKLINFFGELMTIIIERVDKVYKNKKKNNRSEDMRHHNLQHTTAILVAALMIIKNNRSLKRKKFLYEIYFAEGVVSDVGMHILDLNITFG
uniref:Uncharacterized protein n=1 Tax=Heterorhabditis bacteriophora TaxID=37862 RepID=A0A1I7W6A5_HETBA